jgi:hypothetical protein
MKVFERLIAKIRLKIKKITVFSYFFAKSIDF